MKIELNGTLITGRIDGTENFEVTISKKTDEGKIAKSFSSELTFFDDGFQIIKAALIDDPNGFVNSVTIEVFDECCSESVFKGVIRGDSIDFCEPGCSVSANIIEEDNGLNCVKSTMIWDDHEGFLTTRRHPSIRYCIETRPEFIQIILVFLAFIVQIVVFAILIPLIAVIFVIFGIIFIICNIIDAIAALIPGVEGPDCTGGFANPINFINQIIDTFDNLADFLVGCGRYHPSPYVREYIKNVCEKCGLTFQSSILNNASSPYYNAALFAAEVRKGVRAPVPGPQTMIEANRPILTGANLLDEYLKPTFNAEWRVINGVLIFERKDYFQNLSTWINTDQLLQEGRLIDDAVCFSWIDKERFAFGRFEYRKDGQEYIGYEAADRYHDLVEWNSPPSPLQSGEKTVILPFGPARFRDDGVETDVLSFLADFLGGAIDAVFFGAFSDWKEVLLMNQHTAQEYKLLILRDSTPNDNNLVKNNYSNTFTGGTLFGDFTDPGGDVFNGPIANNRRFNYPLWFYEGRDNNLYSLFYFIEDPRLPGSQQFNFEFSFPFKCSEYQSFDFDKSVKIVRGGVLLDGVVEEIKVNFKTRLISVQGIV
jgi:hypothetical protein